MPLATSTAVDPADDPRTPRGWRFRIEDLRRVLDELGRGEHDWAQTLEALNHDADPLGRIDSK